MKADNLARAEELQKVRGDMDAMQDGMLELARDRQHLLKWANRADQQLSLFQEKTDAIEAQRCAVVKQLEAAREDHSQELRARFLSETLAPETRRAVISINGEEVVGEF
jgi:hypothetical protein